MKAWLPNHFICYAEFSIHLKEFIKWQNCLYQLQKAIKYWHTALLLLKSQKIFKMWVIGEISVCWKIIHLLWSYLKQGHIFYNHGNRCSLILVNIQYSSCSLNYCIILDFQKWISIIRQSIEHSLMHIIISMKWVYFD